MPSSSADEYIEFVAANVRRLRTRGHMTQEQLAEAAEIDLTYLQRVERGTANPSLRVLVALATALGVAPGRLLHRARRAERAVGRPSKKRRG